MSQIHLFAALTVAVLFSSCASYSPQSRISKRPEEFAKLSAGQQAMVQEGKIAEGMSMDAVWLAWGPPGRVSRGAENGKSIERWSYTGTRVVYSSGFGVGTGFGYGRHHGRYCDSPYMDYDYGPIYIPYEAAEVNFKNGRVISWRESVR